MKNTQNVIGIDVGGSTTKIVGFRKTEDGKRDLISPFLVRATVPITSIYGHLENLRRRTVFRLAR